MPNNVQSYKDVIRYIAKSAGLSEIETRLAQEQPSKFLEYCTPKIDIGKNFIVVLQDCGTKKISCIKLVREITRLGLKEAKELIESAPIKIIETDQITAESIKERFAEIGAVADIRLASI